MTVLAVLAVLALGQGTWGATAAGTTANSGSPAGASPAEIMRAPYEHPVLKRWLAVTDSKIYDQASAHDPCFNDPLLWPAFLKEDGDPDYPKQAWPKARLLVWARRDADDNYFKKVSPADPANWLEDGKPATTAPDKATDVIFPNADKPYMVNGHFKEYILECRHLTVGRNASVPLWGARVFGNWWIKKGGFIYERHSGGFSGPTHSFARNDNVPAWRPGLGWRPNGWSAEFAPLVHENTQYFWIAKAGGSVEAIGNFSTQDQFHVDAGLFIVGPDSYVGSGVRASLMIEKEAVMQLQSGAALGKRDNQTFNWDMYVKGELRAGSATRPIHRDAFVGLSAKDYIGLADDLGNHGDRVGMFVYGGGRITVHQASGSEDRLRIEWSGGPSLPYQLSDNGDKSRVAAYAWLPKVITVSLPDGLELSHVRFDDLRIGGLRADPSATQLWKGKDVTFGTRCQGPPAALLANADWYSNVVMLPAGPSAALPPGGMAVQLLSDVKDATIYYTLDGSTPADQSKLYSQPLRLTATTLVKAQAYYQNRAIGKIATAVYCAVDKPLPAQNTTGKNPGLAMQGGTWTEGAQPVLEGKGVKGAPPVTGVSPTVVSVTQEVGADANWGCSLDGFITVPETAPYTFFLECGDGPRRRAVVSIDGFQILADGDRANDQRTLALAGGPHRIQVKYFAIYGDDKTLKLSWEAPGLAKQEVPASAYSH
ncbi:MAG: chitobiase/beta-hexosaminidase C-terminal domain-containing protein [Akkermansiaceae bacterium]|nr:chitobiase/beta-hexosaminidase C-terminal domain-containing protein [Akkermansiaceae bacterium]